MSFRASCQGCVFHIIRIPTMSGPPIKRRRTKAIGADSAILAKAYTHKTVTTINRSGISVTKDIRVPLVPTEASENNEATSSTTTHIPDYNHDVPMEAPLFNDMDENINNLNKSKVC
jgi:hypothetical protein